MAELIEKYGTAISPLMQDMAIFFSIFGIPSGAQNLYRDLIDASGNRADILWSTLNYECILESAVAQAGRTVAYFAEPSEAGGGSVPIWKLHGSCNFKVSGLEATRGLTFGSGITFGGGIEPIDPSQVRSTYRGNTVLYPAMALYAKGKPLNMAPDPIRDGQARWATAIANATHVLVIGTQPNPEDDHLWDPLAKTPGRVAYVGDEVAFRTWARLSRANSPWEFLGQRWSGVADLTRQFLLDA